MHLKDEVEDDKEAFNTFNLNNYIITVSPNHNEMFSASDTVLRRVKCFIMNGIKKA